MQQIRKREEDETEQVEVEEQLPPELVQLAVALLEAFLQGDRDSYDALYLMYHDPDKYVAETRRRLRESIKQLLDEGEITPEQAKQMEAELGESSPQQAAKESAASADGPAVESQQRNQVSEIPSDERKVVNPQGRTLREILGMTGG